jgi:transmembrane sensor
MSEPSNAMDEQAPSDVIPGDSIRGDPIWDAAFDWMMRIDRAPQDAAIAASFQAWLAQSNLHAHAYEEVRKVWRAAPHLAPALSEQGRRQRRLAAPARARARLSRRQWLVGAAAAGAAVAFAAGPLGDLFADHATGTGETRSVTLSDGTWLQLDTDSAVRLSFDQRRRAVELLRGRAFFDVAQDAQRPFGVTTGMVQAIALGTKFDVRRDGGRATVAVEEGRVALSLNGRNPLPQDALDPGAAVAIDLATGAIRQSSVNPQVAAAWREGRLVVEAWSVAEVLDELGRYHRGTILLRDDALGARLVSGIYDLTRPVDAVRAVAQSQGGQVQEISPWLLVVSGG